MGSCPCGCLCLNAEHGEDQAKECDTRVQIAEVNREEQLSPPQLTRSAATEIKLRKQDDLYLPCLGWWLCALSVSFLLMFSYSVLLPQRPAFPITLPDCKIPTLPGLRGWPAPRQPEGGR